MQINWEILSRLPNIGETFQQSFQQGRAVARERATEDALAAYAAAPSQDALRPLAVLAPQAYASLSRNEREAAETRRAAQARSIAARFVRERDPEVPTLAVPSAPDVLAAPMQAKDPRTTVASPPATAGDDQEIVVTGRPRQVAPPRQTSIADIYEYDPDLAKQLTDHIGAMAKNDRDAFGAKMEAGAALAFTAKGLPADSRRDYIERNLPLLRQAGWKDDEIASFEPTDDNLDGMIALGVGADKAIADHRAAEGQRITVRGQDVSAATARRGQDISAATARAGQAVTMRGQDISAATARAGQSVTMRGQDMAAAARAAPKPATAALARTKLTALNAIDNQLNRVEAAMRKAKYRGPVAGRLPGGISGVDNAADAAIRQLAPLIRQLTRVPGEGAMSDYESRLAEAGQPSRAQTAEALAETMAGYRDLIRQTRAGYQDILGESPASSGSRGFRVKR